MIFMILYLIILNIGTDFTLKTAQSSLASWIPIPDNIYELVPLGSAYVYWRISSGRILYDYQSSQYVNFSIFGVDNTLGTSSDCMNLFNPYVPWLLYINIEQANNNASANKRLFTHT